MIIDFEKWLDFKISDVFITQKKGKNLQVPTGASIKQKYLEDGDTPRITVTGINNGRYGYFKDIDDPNYRVFENFISVSFLGTVFYQKDKCSLDMKVHCLKPLNHELSKYTGQYLVSAISASLRESSYSDQLSSTVLPNLTIKLPGTKDNQPDWDYMDNYMRNIELSTECKLNFLIKAQSEKSKIDDSEWEEFHLADIFDIISGTGSDRSKMTEYHPTIRLIGRIGFDNGFSKMVDEIDGIKPIKKGCLSLALGGAYLGACFIQPGPFYTGEHMVALVPKKNDMTIRQKMFIATIITKSARLKYKAFLDEMDTHIRTDYTFKLPVSSHRVPAWDRIEKYMESTQKEVSRKLEIIERL